MSVISVIAWILVLDGVFLSLDVVARSYLNYRREYNANESPSEAILMGVFGVKSENGLPPPISLGNVFRLVMSLVVLFLGLCLLLFVV